MTKEIISWAISTKVCDQARIKLVTPGHGTDCATGPGRVTICFGCSEELSH